ELGGHSLLATQVLSRVCQAFQIELPLRRLFEAPTVAGLAECVEIARRAEDSLPAPPLQRIEGEGPPPLSFAQQRLWFLDQLEPGHPFYNIPAALRLTGALDVTALERSLAEIVRRHEVLRTTFAVEDGRPVQAIAPELTLSLPVVDLSGLPAAECESEVRRLAWEEAQRPFDLTRGPLERVTLLRLGDREHVLLLTLHHIVADGWSIGICLRELAALYTAFTSGRPSPLPELPIQYADFARWQRQWLQGDILDNQLAYWKERLAGVPALELPTDRPRPAVQTFRGATCSWMLSDKFSRRLQGLSRREGATLYMVLLAAFQALLHRYTGQDDIAVGSPIANRTRAETEGLIGFFVNTLVLRTDLSGNPSFRELLARVREAALGAFAHQDLPFERLVEELQPRRDLSRSPLFQVLFTLQNTPLPQLELPGLKPSLLEVPVETAKFDLSLTLAETGQGLCASLEYNTDLFEAATIRRLLGHWQTLLEDAVADPEKRLSELPLLTEPERHQLLVEWTDTRAAYPQDQYLPRLFEDQAERTPEAVAVAFEGERLTYAELNARANRLAHHLRTLGVGPDVLVGIGMERSVEMVVGLLAVLKAGGAYVPLDPTYPQERLAFMLQDTQARVLLTQERLAGKLPAHAARVICLDPGWETFLPPVDANPAARITPDHLAYVIYTSGSTGQPKGVAMPHRPLVNLIAWQLAHSSAGLRTRTLQFTTLSFDVAFQEIFATWCSGGTLVLVREEARRDLDGLPSLLEEQEIHRLFLPFVALQQLAAACCVQGRFPRCLKEVITAGEQLQITPAIARMFGELPGCTLHNHYGPTESHVVAAFRLSGPPAEWPPLPPIGRPIANSQVYLLDRWLQPVPVGFPGELYIGGTCLARGYLNRPELTDERFVPYPFRDRPGARLYRTGDLARWLPTGELVYLGRTDFQVKVRGFRVEPGEIENVLAQHPAVREAVVLAREDVPGDRRLVAYVTARQEPALSLKELRGRLLEQLPGYMVPSAFVVLDALPLTPSGKVDRRALPAPERNRPALDREWLAPRTPVEEVLAGLWAEVLGLERVGAQDNFFELGGHSLLATQVVSRLRAAFQVELPLRFLFEAPTVAALAERIEAARRSGQSCAGPPLRPVPRDGYLPLSFAQQRLWFLDQFEPDSSFYNIPAAIRLTGPLDVAALEQSLQELIRRHEVLRTTFAQVAGQLVQVITPTLAPPLVMEDLTSLFPAERELEVRRRAEEEARRPFDLGRGPLFRVTVLDLGAGEKVLLLTMHHIIADGWSVGVFLREMTCLYAAFTGGKPITLPPLPVQYADYAAWQRQWLTGEVLEEQLAYWKDRLAQAPAALDLPTDRPRPTVQTFRGSTQSLTLPRSLAEHLHALSRREGCTLYMTLLAAFQTLLHRYTGQEDICVGSPIAGRTRAETEGLIGCCINALVLRTDLSGDPSFRDLLARVRETALGAYAHQDLPFEKLVEELQPARDLSRSPLFQVMFILQNTPLPELDLPGLTVRPLDLPGTTAKFDLTLSLAETQQGLQAAVEYNTDLFDAGTITRLLGHFQKLLEGLAGDPGQRLSELPLLTAEEKQQLLVAWNDTATVYPEEHCLHRLVEAQVERTPDATALVFEGESLTYRELNARANRLAHHLLSLGVGPDVLVGISMERSVEMVVGLLGILKAGGAYVPLDPAYPQERLAFMLEDARLPVLLTQQRLAARLPAHQARVLCLDSDWDTIAAHAAGNLDSGVMPEHLAYVIYTSGSTGRPKGAMNTHRGICNRLLWMQQQYQLTPADVVLQKTPFSFDVSVWEFFWPLLSGATLVVARPGGHQDSAYLVRLIAAEHITVLHFVPSMLQVFLEEKGLEACTALRHVMCSGEDLPYDLQQRCHLRLPGELHNLYGPTEAAVDVSFWQCRPNHPRGIVPIGRPIANTQLYVLDSHLRPVPVGVPGELHIGGVGLARGYLNRPELTAAKFIPNPLPEAPSPRLYRTGDRARWLPDGTIEYLGRLDHQVKIRGFRIELGEIEAVLGQHPAVREAVVLAREDEPGEKRLTAYVVAYPGAELSAATCRSFLKEKLPDYMVPSAFVFLKALPLSPNGKVDRRALPAPDRARPELERGYVAARNPVEEKLAAIFAGVLHLERVGVLDNFFDLGGHSLAVLDVLARVREVCGIDIPLREFFASPTVAGLAERVDAIRRHGPRLDPGTPVADLNQEVLLDPAIQPESWPTTLESEPRNILLTGATGFLGAFLVDELLKQTQAHLHCLVRAASAEEGKNKLLKNLEAHGLGSQSANKRIVAVPGDLSRPLLGLTQEQFDALAARIDVLYHNGALVNFVYPYEALKAANVQGTHEVLWLACRGRVKPVHYVSTVSVFDPTRINGTPLAEEHSLDHGGRLEGGY
ncbi:MAG: amino acid adenylation domain-containing protein, partial [Planctomycetes bacterium]|nr:amino acid adenylation domain-containing protein [Planctomycetota bacterium]